MTNKLTKEQRENIYQIAIKKWGEGLQCLMFFEESAELCKLLCKHLRGKNPSTAKITEEIADVYNVLDQLMFMFDCKVQVEEIRDQKLVRMLKIAQDEEIIQEMR
jgi:hypothetical protein